MLHRTMQQFLTDVYFGDLDVLLLDLPPGTGDVAISVGQLLPHAEVLVVTTPQPAAADVAVRCGLVARQTGQRVIGVVENMAPAALPDGSDARAVRLRRRRRGRRTALPPRASRCRCSASVPLSAALRQDGDAGMPVVLAHPADPAALAIAAIAAAVGSRPARPRGPLAARRP